MLCGLILFMLFPFSAPRVLALQEQEGSDSIRVHFDPIVVTGQRYEMTQKDVAASVSVISPSQLKHTGFSTVADAVSLLTPSVFTTRKSTMGYGVAALAAGTMTVRGVGGKPNSQVLVLIDGRPDFQGIFSHPINDGYLLSTVDHIEVLRGPASAVYGTNALGGVINIITKKLPHSGFHSNFSIDYGSYDTQRYQLQQSGRIDDFRFALSVGLHTSEGHRDNASFESRNYGAKIGYRLNEHFDVTFNGNMIPYQFHDPGPQDINLMGYFEEGDITRYSMDLTLRNTFGTTDGTLKIHGNFGKHELSDGWESEDQTVGVFMFQNVIFHNEARATLGVDVKRYGGESYSGGTDLGTYYNDEYAAYLHIQKVIQEKLILATGLRLEDNSYFGAEWIPKFGLVYHAFPKTSLRTSVAKGFRTPSIRDLYLFPPANINLKPERLWNYEIAVSRSVGEALSLDLCGFFYEGDQWIETVVIAPGMTQNQNSGSNSAQGLEMTVQARPTDHLSAYIALSYLDSKERLPFAPNKADFLITYDAKRVDISLYGEHIAHLYTSYQLNQYPIRTTIERQSPYTLINAKAQLKISPHLSLSLIVENLFDEPYEILKGYPMPGRTFSSGVQYYF